MGLLSANADYSTGLSRRTMRKSNR